MTDQPEMLRRVAAAQATLDAFIDQPFSWGAGDCVQLAAFNLAGLGYDAQLARGGTYDNMLGARRALKRAGFADLESALDGLGLPRIGFASALPGDVVGLNSGADWPALGVALGNGRVLAFNEQTGRAAIAGPNVEDIRCVWRAAPCLRQ